MTDRHSTAGRRGLRVVDWAESGSESRFWVARHGVHRQCPETQAPAEPVVTCGGASVVQVRTEYCVPTVPSPPCLVPRAYRGGVSPICTYMSWDQPMMGEMQDMYECWAHVRRYAGAPAVLTARCSGTNTNDKKYFTENGNEPSAGGALIHPDALANLSLRWGAAARPVDY